MDRLVLGGKKMLRLWEAFQAHITNDEDGASMVEYALLVALIAIVAIAAVILVGQAVSGEFSQVDDHLG
jgi:pilus assembly protein Flp/PilA